MHSEADVCYVKGLYDVIKSSGFFCGKGRVRRFQGREDDDLAMGIELFNPPENVKATNSG